MLRAKTTRVDNLPDNLAKRQRIDEPDSAVRVFFIIYNYIYQYIYLFINFLIYK